MEEARVVEMVSVEMAAVGTVAAATAAEGRAVVEREARRRRWIVKE